MSEAPLTIIAGVGPGMGLAIARRFAAEGHRLALLARRAKALTGYAAGIEGRAQGYACDLSDPEAVVQGLARIREAEGAASVLVWNAAAWIEARAMTLSIASFRQELDLAVTGALAAAQAVHPDMAAAGRGAMLFTGGGLALFPQYGTAVPGLTAGKSALRGLVHAMAGELRPQGIRVGLVTIAGTVAPGGAFDPDRIAEHYTRLASLPAEDATVEIVHDGKAAG